MLVKDYMTKHPLMVQPTMPVIEAQRFMGENNIRHLPIVGKGKRLLGLVTRQTLLVQPAKLGSLNVWEITRFLSNLTVGDVMVKAKDVVTVEKDATIEEAAHVMVENKIGCLPVLEEGIVVGIITEIDLLAELTEMMATRVPGVRVTVRMPDVTGELAKLVSAISVQGWGILACGGAPSPKDPSKWDAVVKIRNVPKEEIVAALEKVEGQKIVDVREV
jgi:acetoin utilization protein AcuB